MHPLTAYALGVAVFGLVVYAVIDAVGKYDKRYNVQNMPGPWQVPWVGRIHDLPIEFMWLKFKEWADTYGPIYRTKMLGANFIIITDEKIAEDMLVKKAKLYSDRPEIKSLFDAKSTYGSMEYLPLMGKNQYWARQRKFTHSYLTGATNVRYNGIMEFEAKRWMARLLENPDDFSFSLEDMCSKVMCQLTWDDPSLSIPLTPSAWGLLTQMSPAGPITNVLTPLWDWVPEPINPWKLRERKRHDDQQAFFMQCLQKTKKSMEKGKQRSCFTKNYLKTAEKSNISGDYEASCVIGMMALVGIFTVTGPIYGVAHEAEADDWFQGYFIPKGTRILPLDWAFLRNPVKYPQPEEFHPERWLEAGWPTFQEPLTKYPDIVGMTSFGWGQRQCLGMSITRDETVTGCGALMWAFNLRRKVDPVSGMEIEVPLNKSNSLLIIKPDAWEMAFQPRSESRKQEVIQLWKEAEAKDIQERAAFAKAAEVNILVQP